MWEECELKVQEMLKTKLKVISKRIVAIVLLVREEAPAYYLQNGKIEKKGKIVSEHVKDLKGTGIFIYEDKDTM